MNEDCILHYGEPQAGAAQLARASFVYTVEAFEQTVQMFGRNADAGIGKTEIIVILVFAETADVDVYVGAGISDGVVHEVAEDGVEQRVVAPQLYLRF